MARRASAGTDEVLGALSRRTDRTAAEIAEAAGIGRSALRRPPSHRQSGKVASPTPSTPSEVTPEPSARMTPNPPGAAKTM